MKSSLLYNLTIAKHPTLNHLIVRSVLCNINLLQSPHIIVEYDIASHNGTMHEHHRIYHQLRLTFTLRVWHALLLIYGTLDVWYCMLQHVAKFSVCDLYKVMPRFQCSNLKNQ